MAEGATPWTALLAELAQAAMVPGAELGVWADGALNVTPWTTQATGSSVVRTRRTSGGPSRSPRCPTDGPS